MTRAPRRLAVALVALAVAGLVGDPALRELTERQVADALAAEVGWPVEVELQRWPVTWRLLTARPVEADVQVRAGDGGAPLGQVRLVDARVHGPVVDLLRGRPHRITAPRASAEGTVLGGASAQAVVAEVEISLAGDHPRLSARSLQAHAPPDGPRVRVVLRGVEVVATGTPVVRVRSGVVRTDGSGPLPVPAQALEARVRAATWSSDGFRAEHASIDARDVELDGAPVTLQRLTADLPDAALTSTGGTATMTSPDGRFTTELDTDAVNALWTGPGRISLLEGRARLSAGPADVDFALDVRDGAVVLEPRLPSLLSAVVGALPALRVRPRLPDGMVLESAQVEVGALWLGGSAQRLQIPTAPG